MKSPKALSLTAATAVLLAATTSAENFTQPILWQDLPDTDLIRVDDVYYYSASNMHFSPGAPILRSYDLVNWEYLSHSIPFYDFDPRFSLQDGNAYNGGVYASSLRFHEATHTFYWMGCIVDDGRTFVYEASEIEGPWTQTTIIEDHCYYDNGILFDDDGSTYVSFCKWIPEGDQAKIQVAQLTDDLQHDHSEVVFNTTAEIDYIEGTRFYKINGTYYILLTNPGVGEGEIILKSSGGPFGPYDSWHRMLENNGNPVPGGSSPYQGAIIETSEGDWWYMAFINLYPGGRYPVLAPLTWDDDGWPNVQFVDGDWGSTYPYPLPKRTVTPITGTDNFSSCRLGPQYEWNHSPDDSKWTVGRKAGGLALQAATVTDDFFAARNTLSHRTLGPMSVATIELDYSSLADGDTAGLSVFRYDAAWVGVHKGDANDVRVQMVNNVLMNSTGGWHTVNKGEVIAEEQLQEAGSVWLRASIDISDSPGFANFSYSTDGKQFTDLGEQHQMTEGAVFFMGDRYGIFNFATKELGGKAIIKSFTLSEA